MLDIAIAEKKLDLGLHHDSFDKLEEVKQKLEGASDIDPKVYSYLAQTYAAYYRRKEDHENFYLSTL